MFRIKVSALALFAVATLTLGIHVEAALQQGTARELSDYKGAPKGSLYNTQTDGALLGGCGPGAKEFLKKNHRIPQVSMGLNPRLHAHCKN